MPTRIKVSNGLLRGHNPYDTVAVSVFTIGDVVDRAHGMKMNIMTEEAILILEQVHHDQSAEHGINWSVIDQAILNFKSDEQYPWSNNR
jgi:hypothetical protein